MLNSPLCTRVLRLPSLSRGDGRSRPGALVVGLESDGISNQRGVAARDGLARVAATGLLAVVVAEGDWDQTGDYPPDGVPCNCWSTWHLRKG